MNVQRRKLFLLAFSLLGLLFPALLFAQGLVPCDNACNFDDLITLIQQVMKYLIYFVATPLAAILFAIAGFYYMTAGEDAGKVKKGHDIFVSVLWGFGIMLIAWALVSFIINLLTNNPAYSLLAP